MALSIAAKQNYLYIIFVIASSIGTIMLYRSTQQDWIIFRKAEIKFANKEYEAAIALYKKSLEAGLPFSKTAVNLANSYVTIGNFKEAAVIYKKYLVEFPKDTKVRLQLAKTLSYTGNLKESEVEYKKILEDTHKGHQTN